MALLPENQNDQLKFLGVVVLLGLGGLYWLYWYSPRSEELTQREERLAQVGFENRRAEVRVGNLDELREDLKTRRTALEELERLIPSTAEVAGLYDEMARISQSLGLEMVSVTPRPLVREEGQYFFRQRWSMVLEGGYHQVGRFLSEVASMSRLVRPSVTRVVPAAGTDNAADVRADMQLETFVLPPDTGSSPAAGQAASEGGESGG